MVIWPPSAGPNWFVSTACVIGCTYANRKSDSRQHFKWAGIFGESSRKKGSCLVGTKLPIV